MRESRTYGSVRGGHRKVLVYSIVGQGNERISRQAPRTMVVLTGPRTDPGGGHKPVPASFFCILAFKSLLQRKIHRSLQRKNQGKFEGSVKKCTARVRSITKKATANAGLNRLVQVLAH